MEGGGRIPPLEIETKILGAGICTGPRDGPSSLPGLYFPWDQSGGKWFHPVRLPLWALKIFPSWTDNVGSRSGKEIRVPWGSGENLRLEYKRPNLSLSPSSALLLIHCNQA